VAAKANGWFAPVPLESCAVSFNEKSVGQQALAIRVVRLPVLSVVRMVSSDTTLDDVIPERRKENLIPGFRVLEGPDHQPHFPGNIEIIVGPQEMPTTNTRKRRCLHKQRKLSVEVLQVAIASI